MNKEDIKNLPSKIKKALINIYIKITPKKLKNIIDVFIKKTKLCLSKTLLFILPDTISKDENSTARLKRIILILLTIFLAQIIVVILIVFITVKTGGQSFTMPNVVGLEMFEAFDRVQKEKMNLNIEARRFDNEKLGTVVIQEPRGGTIVKRGRTVSLVINAIPESIVSMPSLTGKTYEESMMIISNSVLSKVASVKILPPTESYDAKQKLNVVINQIPFENEEITENTEIMLVINRQPKEISIKIPNLKDIDINTALKTFEGYSVNIKIQNMETSDSTLIGKVTDQSPIPGTYAVSSLTNILLTVGSSVSEQTKTIRFTYTVPTDKVEQTALKIVLDDKNGRRDIFNKNVRAADNISFNYVLSGKGVITLFYDDIPFQTINVE